MTKIKLCGLRRPEDIEAANLLSPEYVGFVFAPKSRRYIPPEEAAQLRKKLLPDICAVGVFVNETPERVAALLEEGIIHMAQLHGREDETYIKMLRGLTKKPLIQAFRMDGVQAAAAAENSSADYILLDSGAGGTGLAFDWDLLSRIRRPYFLAGGWAAGVSYWVAGIPFDLAHCGGNFIAALALFVPLRRALERLKASMGRAAKRE